MDVDEYLAPLLADIDAEDLARFIDIVGDVSGQAVLWLMRSLRQDAPIRSTAKCWEWRDASAVRWPLTLSP